MTEAAAKPGARRRRPAALTRIAVAGLSATSMFTIVSLLAVRANEAQVVTAAAPARLANPQRLRQRAQHPIRLCNSGERHKPHPIREYISHPGGCHARSNPDAQAGLAHARHPRKRHQPDVCAPEHFKHSNNFALTAYKHARPRRDITLLPTPGGTFGGCASGVGRYRRKYRFGPVE